MHEGLKNVAMRGLTPFNIKYMKRRTKSIGFILYLSCAFSWPCAGALEQSIHELYKTHEKIVFGHEAKRVASKYLISGFGPDPDASLPHLPVPLSEFNEKIKRFEDEFAKIFQRIQQDESATFDKIVNLLPNCSSKELAVTILVVDNLWPEKKAEIRSILQRELDRRGQAATVEATFRSGWLEYRSGTLSYRECSMTDLIENTTSN